MADGDDDNNATLFLVLQVQEQDVFVRGESTMRIMTTYFPSYLEKNIKWKVPLDHEEDVDVSSGLGPELVQPTRK